MRLLVLVQLFSSLNWVLQPKNPIISPTQLSTYKTLLGNDLTGEKIHYLMQYITQ